MSVITAQLYTLRDYCKTPKDTAETLEKVAKIGFKSVQVSGVGPIDPKELKNILDANGLELTVTHNGFDAFAHGMDRLIEDHLLWNCKYVGLGSMPGHIYPRTREGFVAFAQTAAAWSEKLAKHGLIFVYHNHSFEFVRFGKKTGYDLIVENCGVGQMELDTFWVQAGGADPAATIRSLKGRMDILHLKDFDVDAADRRRMREVGEGNLNWKAILAACAEIGIKRYIIEQDDCNGLCPFDCLATSFRNLKEMGLS